MPIFGALGDGLAEQMGSEHSAGDIIEGDVEMVEGDRGIEIGVFFQCGDTLSGGDMFHDDGQVGESRGQCLINGDKLRLSIHDKSVGFSMDAQRDTQIAHGTEGGAQCLNIEAADTSLGVGGDPGGIKFDSGEIIAERFEESMIIVGLEKEGHVRRKTRRLMVDG